MHSSRRLLSWIVASHIMYVRVKHKFALGSNVAEVKIILAQASPSQWPSVYQRPSGSIAPRVKVLKSAFSQVALFYFWTVSPTHCLISAVKWLKQMVGMGEKRVGSCSEYSRKPQTSNHKQPLSYRKSKTMSLPLPLQAIFLRFLFFLWRPILHYLFSI